MLLGARAAAAGVDGALAITEGFPSAVVKFKIDAREETALPRSNATIVRGGVVPPAPVATTTGSACPAAFPAFPRGGGSGGSVDGGGSVVRWGELIDGKDIL